MTDKTANVAPPYHVQETGADLRGGFPYFAHHESVSALWRDKWRKPCQMGIYPFTDALVDDLDPIFEELQAVSNDDPSILLRPDQYASSFLPVGDRLVKAARLAEEESDIAQAMNLFLRAAAVYRIGRFPINRSPRSEEAWQKGKDAYVMGGQHLDPPIVPVGIAFSHADVLAGDTDVPIQAYLRTPSGEAPDGGWPVLLFICGLDAYKTDHTPRTQQHVDRGFATLSFEIPGTGDCPAAPGDPTAADRLMSSVLDWVADQAAERSFDIARVVARGISTGGYYAMRVAHTHADRLFAVVAQGGGCHHMFDTEWIRAQDQMEYPFALAEALAHKFGFRDPDSRLAVESYAAGGKRFSLLESGVLDQPSCRLLLVNGWEDSIFPVEDNLVVGLRGANKDLVLRGNRGHMGNPGAEEILGGWLDDVMAGKP